MVVMVKLNYIWLTYQMFIEYTTELDVLPWKLKKGREINKEEPLMKIPDRQSTYSCFCWFHFHLQQNSTIGPILCSVSMLTSLKTGTEKSLPGQCTN